MSISKDILNDAHLAKAYITNSDLSDDYKKSYLKLIDITTTATNGITPEEKIQKMTEAILLLVINQGRFVVDIGNTVNEQIKIANGKQCENCTAMSHAIKCEQREQDEKRINAYLIDHGVSPEEFHKNIQNKNNFQNKSTNTDKQSKKTWSDVIKDFIINPYFYITVMVMSVSPHGVDIIKAILDFCK